MEWRTPLHLSVVAIDKEAFRSPSTKGRQLYLLIITWSYKFLKRMISISDLIYKYTQKAF